MSVKLLTEHHFEFLSLKGGCRGLSESTHVKMAHCFEISCTGSFTISAVRSKAVVLLLLTFCLLLLPLWESVICSMFCCMLLYDRMWFI